MTKVKICGLSEIKHALAAAEAGADFLGMIFTHARRQISPEKALTITEAVHNLKHPPPTVGVFVNSPSQDINLIADYCRLNWIQLNGDEPWEYCQEIEKPVIKALHVSPDTTTEEILIEIERGKRTLPRKQVTYLMDTRIGAAYGGTGQPFNRQLAKEVSMRFPVVIAGGLTPKNIGELLLEVKPWGVDVSSGVETDGRKDNSKIKAFIELVRKAERCAESSKGGSLDSI